MEDSLFSFFLYSFIYSIIYFIFSIVQLIYFTLSTKIYKLCIAKFYSLLVFKNVFWNFTCTMINSSFYLHIFYHIYLFFIHLHVIYGTCSINYNTCVFTKIIFINFRYCKYTEQWWSVLLINQCAIIANPYL